MLTYSMILAPQQKGSKMSRRENGAILPETIGETVLCENMRERISGKLESAGSPATITSLTSPIVCTDKRGDKQYLFGLSNSKRLTIEGCLRHDYRYEAINAELATLDCGITSSASVGEFLVFLLDDGTLWYLLWNSDLETYTPLGRLPAMPRIDARMVQETEYQETVSGVTFDKPASDFRTEIPSEIRESVGQEALKAWQRGETAAHSSGRWTQPVSVRFAVRLWDGRILHVSEPQIVAFETGYQRPSRLLLPLKETTGGFSGTSATELNHIGFKIGVSVEDGWNIGNWKEVIRGIEVWVSSSVDVIDCDSDVLLSAYSSSSTNYLSAILPMKSTDTLITEISDRQYYRHSLLTPDMLPKAEIEYNPSAEKNFAETMPLTSQHYLDIKAKTILGHDGFLHIGNVSRSFPKPVVHASSDEGLSIRCIVSVDICSPFGLKRVSTETTLSSPRLSPLLSYPDRDAVRMEIKMQCDDGVRYGSYLLKAKGDEDASVYVEDTLQPIEPVADETEEFVAGENIGKQEIQPSTIITTERGNPFVERSSSRNSGGEIMAMAAQGCGGGAYTRQFVYLFTNRGIIALTHKSCGEHTNCRTIASDIVTDSRKISNAADGVYALSLSGDLIRLNDARRHTLLSGLEGAATLAWNRATEELWIIPNPSATGSWQRSIVIQIMKNFRAWLSTSMPYRLISNNGEPLYLDSGFVSPAESSYVGVLKTIAKEDSTSDNQQWISSAIDNPKRGLTIGRIGIFGEDVDAGVSVEMVAEGDEPLGRSDSRTVIDEFHVTGDFTAPVETHFIIGNHSKSPALFPGRKVTEHSKLRFRILGHIPKLCGISLV